MPGRNDEGKGRDHDWGVVAAVGSYNSARLGFPAATNDDLVGESGKGWRLPLALRPSF